jgi:hypothetical protein
LSENAMLALVRQLAEMQNQFFEHSQLQMQMMTEMLAHLGRGQQDLVRRDLSRIDDIGRELKDLQSQLTQPARKQRSKPRSAARRPAASKPGSTSQDELASADASLSPASSTAPDRMAIDPPPALETPAIEAPALDAPALDAPELESPAIEAPAPLIEADETVPESRIPAPSPEFQPPATECDTDSDPPGAESSGQPTEEPGEPDSLDAHARLTRRMARLAQERNNRWRRVLQAFKRKP